MKIVTRSALDDRLLDVVNHATIAGHGAGLDMTEVAMSHGQLES
jgi:hypothetical protein